MVVVVGLEAFSEREIEMKWHFLEMTGTLVETNTILEIYNKKEKTPFSPSATKSRNRKIFTDSRSL